MGGFEWNRRVGMKEADALKSAHNVCMRPMGHLTRSLNEELCVDGLDFGEYVLGALAFHDKLVNQACLNVSKAIFGAFEVSKLYL
jgi:hypothetical protein